jgi:hypothetical protein
MSVGPVDPVDPSRMQLDAEQIVSSLLQQKPDLIDEARVAFGPEPAVDLSELLSTGESVVAGEPEAEMIVASDDDIESIMRALLEENSQFAAINEDVRRSIVVEAVYAVLAEGK